MVTAMFLILIQKVNKMLVFFQFYSFTIYRIIFLLEQNKTTGEISHEKLQTGFNLSWKLSEILFIIYIILHVCIYKR